MQVTRLFAVTAGVVILVLSTGSREARAAPCDSTPAFQDIAQADIFCTDAEWLKNRGVTTGCTATLFCPGDVVTRAQMALFMQRLGTALSPTTLRIDESPGAIDLDGAGPIIACQSGDVTPTFPQVAIITTTFAGEANGPLQYAHEIYQSTNSGANWIFTNQNINRNGAGSAHWVSSNTTLIRNLDVGTTYRWGVRLGRENGTGDFAQSRCFINVARFSRTSTTSPFDEGPAVQLDR